MSKVKLNTAIVSGFVSNIYLSANGNVISLHMLVDTSYYDNEQWVNRSELVIIKSFNVNKIARYKELTGSTIIVEGNLRSSSYERQDGTKVYETYILANKITQVEVNEKYKEEHPVNGSSNGESYTNEDGGYLNLDGIEE